MTETYEVTEECLKTNYYGVKRTAEAFVPLLQLSDLPRIVNISSSAVMLKVEFLQNPSEEIIPDILIINFRMIKKFLLNFVSAYDWRTAQRSVNRFYHGREID